MLGRIRHNDSEINLDIDLDWNVLFIKQRACQILQLQFDQYNLLLDHRRLEEEDRLSTYLTSDESEVLLILAKREIKNRFFVFCYSCDSLAPALLSVNCETCGKPDFTATTIIEAQSIATGNCCDTFCSSTRGRVTFLCLKDRAHDPSVLLEQVKRNLELVPCAACFNEGSDILVRFCRVPNHALCIDCFKVYSHEYLENGLFQLVPQIGFTLGCPAGCPNAFITDPHHFRIVGREFYSRYKEFAASRYICANDSVVCPQCGQIWDTSDDSQISGAVRNGREQEFRLYTCHRPTGCGSLFCASCNWFYTGAPTDSPDCHCRITASTRTTTTNNTIAPQSVPAWRLLSAAAGGGASYSAIAKLCRPCPKCKSPTEKSGGCNHMHCSICASDWCWICCEPWTSDCQALHWL